MATVRALVVPVERRPCPIPTDLPANARGHRPLCARWTIVRPGTASGACSVPPGRRSSAPARRRSCDPAPARHRDWLLPCTASTTRCLVPSTVVRSSRATSSGLALGLPERNRGIHGCFLELYGTSLATQCGHWARTLPRLVADDRDAGRSAHDSIAHSLAQLGVADDEWEDYLGAELLALRGWAGIVRQIEERPIACGSATSL